MRKKRGPPDGVVLLCCPCLCPFYYTKAAGSTIKKTWRNYERERKAINPPKECKTGSDLREVKEAEQLMRHRPRATHKHWCVQKGCVLLKMPVEIRTLIYQEVRGARNGAFIGISDAGLFGNGDPYNPHAGQAIDVVSLMSTCRQIYADIIQSLYSGLTYTIPNALTFFAFCGSIPARHFHQLRKIRLDFIRRDGICETHRSKVHNQLDFTFLHRCAIQNWHNSKVLQLGKNAPSEVSNLVRKYIPKNQSGKKKIGSFWIRVCVVLSRMESLQNLHVDMTFSDTINTELVLEPLEMLDRKALNSLVVEFKTTSDAAIWRTDRWTRVTTAEQNNWLHSEIFKHNGRSVLDSGAQDA